MNENNKSEQNRVADQQLEEIVGGYGADSSSGNNIPKVITCNKSKYSSGDFPKYTVGQRLTIECTCHGIKVKLPCEVLSVSETATGGFWYKEFVYSIKMMDVCLEAFSILSGKVYQSVYESCLYEV